MRTERPRANPADACDRTSCTEAQTQLRRTGATGQLVALNFTYELAGASRVRACRSAYSSGAKSSRSHSGRPANRLRH